MDHKKFIAELQKRSGLEKSRLNDLLHVTSSVISEQAVFLNDISLGKLGNFETHKYIEFIHTNPATGETLLYPPRIVTRFIPSSEINSALTKIKSDEQSDLSR